MVKWKDYGGSSLTLLAVYCRMDKAKPTIPYDPSDFKRCIHLFECLDLGQGEIFNLLCQTADKYPEWRIFADNWDVLTYLYIEEKDQESAPKLYETMLNLRKSNEVKPNSSHD
jgi:hypothetical protein